MRVFFFLSLFLTLPAAGSPLTIDLSNRLISVTSDFKGDNIVLFGVKKGKGNIITVVRGPKEQIIARRKERHAGIWVDRKTATFLHLPSYYSMGALQPVSLPRMIRRNHYVGPDFLNTDIEESLSLVEKSHFFEAVLRHKKQKYLYQNNPITYLGDGLFKSVITIPENAPIGSYQIDVLLTDKGQIKDRRRLALIVQKSGFNESVSSFAKNHAVLYAIVALLIAAFSGWVANFLFAKH